MDKSNPPTSFGVFKPVGHIVVALENDAQAQALSTGLLALGFAATDLVHYTPDEMKSQVQAQLLTASPLASMGQDLNLIKAHHALAERQFSFLVVHAPKSEQVAQVTLIAKSLNARSAQRYGSLIVEELITSPDDAAQTFESPDTGLDSPAVDGARP